MVRCSRSASGWARARLGDPADWVGILKLVLGTLLVLVALRTWGGRPRGGADAGLPTWMQSIDAFRAPKSLAMGALLSGVNPRISWRMLDAFSADLERRGIRLRVGGEIDQVRDVLDVLRRAGEGTGLRRAFPSVAQAVDSATRARPHADEGSSRSAPPP